MMSLATIQEINRERAIEAAEDGTKPFVYFSADEVDQIAGFPLPHIGDYRPDGWTLVDTHFVDSSGFGTPGEPALTGDEFRAIVRASIRQHAADHELVGWAVIEAGQFQVRVGEFTRPV